MRGEGEVFDERDEIDVEAADGVEDAELAAAEATAECGAGEEEALEGEGGEGEGGDEAGQVPHPSARTWGFPRPLPQNWGRGGTDPQF